VRKLDLVRLFSSAVLCLWAVDQVYITSPAFSNPAKTTIKVTAGNSAEKHLAFLLKLRAVDDRYSVRAYFDEHADLLNNPRALTECALNYASMRCTADAMRLIGRALQLSRNDEYVLSSYAWILYKNNNPNAALRSVNQALKLKESARNLAVLSEICQAMDDAVKADEALSRAVKIDFDSFDVVAAQVRLSKWQMRSADAIKFVSEYLKKHPRDLRALVLRSEAFEILGRNRDAIADLTEVIKQKPDHLYAHQKLAERYQREKNYKAAVDTLRTLMRFKLDASASILANVTMAECLESMGDLKGALQARKRNYLLECKINGFDLIRGDMKNLNGAFARDSIEYCRLAVTQKEYATALKILNSILQKYPNSTQARNLRALALGGLSRWSEALSDWDRLISKQSSYPKWYESRASVYEKLGKSEEAKRDRDTAKRLSVDP